MRTAGLSPIDSATGSVVGERDELGPGAVPNLITAGYLFFHLAARRARRQFCLFKVEWRLEAELSSGPAAVDGVGRVGDHSAEGGGEPGGRFGYLVWNDESFDRCFGEHDLFEYFVGGNSVGAGLCGDLVFDEGVLTYPGLMQLLVTPCGPPSRAITFERPSSPCLAAT